MTSARGLIPLPCCTRFAKRSPRWPPSASRYMCDSVFTAVLAADGVPDIFR